MTTVIRCDSETQWLAERRKSLGGSDAPGIFNLTSIEMGHVSAFRVALEKLGKAPARDVTEQMKMGRALEPAIRNLYSDRTWRAITYPGPFVIHRHDEHTFMHASIDGVIDGAGIGPGVLECKLSSAGPSEWEEGSPLRLATEIQLQQGMICTGMKWGAAAVLSTHFRATLITFDTKLNESFASKLIQRERIFWNEIHSGILPDPTSDDSDHQLIRSIHPRDNGKTIMLNDIKHVIQFEEMDLAERQRKDAEDREARAKNGLENAIGDHTYAVLANGVRLSLRSTRDGKRVLRREWEKR